MTASLETPTNPADETKTAPAGNEPKEPEKTPAEPKEPEAKEPEKKEPIRDFDAALKSRLEAQERVYQKQLKAMEEQLATSNKLLSGVKSAFGLEEKANPEQTAKEAETLKSKMVELEQDKKLILNLSGRGDIHPNALDDVISKVKRDAIDFDTMAGIDTEIERLKEAKPFLFVSKEEKQQAGGGTASPKPPVSTDPLSGFTAEEIESAKMAGYTHPETQASYLRSQRKIKERYKKKE